MRAETTVASSEQNTVHEMVQERYGSAARSQLQMLDLGSAGSSCCSTAGCCGESSQTGTIGAISPITRDLYDPETPFDAALAASLGCGNPTALAELHPGEVVLDLGSGGGLDVLLSAARVAPDGHAYGLDMTDEMLELARRNQAEAGVTNASFIKGQIEQLPLPDASVDVVISNCVINLSPDKDAVLAEAFRVLRPGGRFAVSDIVLLREIPDALRGVVALWTGCVSGSLRDSDYLAKLGSAGFIDAGIEITRHFDRAELDELADTLVAGMLPAEMSLDQAVAALDGAFASAFVRATKPLR